MIKIDVTLHFTSPPTIGSGAREGTLAQRGFIKARDGWPYIPATAFKGKVRHAVERVARGMDREVCATHHKMCRDPQKACPACRIFGSPWIPGRVDFVDLELSGPQALVERRKDTPNRPPIYPHRYGVGINRRRKVAGDNLLYTTELFEPGVPVDFSGALTGAIDRESAAWLVAGLHLMAGLGQGKSAGLSWCHASVTVREEGEEISPAQLRAALNQGQPDQQKKQEVSG